MNYMDYCDWVVFVGRVSLSWGKLLFGEKQCTGWLAVCLMRKWSSDNILKMKDTLEVPFYLPK